MSENENGNSPQGDSTEAKTTIGMPTPPREEVEALTALDQIGSDAQVGAAEAPLVIPEEIDSLVVQEPIAAPEFIPVSPAAPTVASPAPPVSVAASASAEDEDQSALTWPIDPDHANAVSVLSEQMSGVELYGSGYVPPKPSRALNFILLLLVIGVGVVGSAALKFYSSSDREARLMEQAICKADYDALQKLTAQKQYGTLVIESEPKQATVLKSVDGGPMQVIMGKTADGKEIETLTPATLKDLDINRSYQFKLKFTDTLKRSIEPSEEEKKARAKAKEEGKELDKLPVEELKVDYRDEEFMIARYQWIQDGATGSFRFQKIVPLTPDYIEYYHTFNWEKGKAERFESQKECEDFQRDHDATICRAISRTEDWAKKDARDEEEAKKSKGGRRR